MKEKANYVLIDWSKQLFTLESFNEDWKVFKVSENFEFIIDYAKKFYEWNSNKDERIYLLLYERQVEWIWYRHTEETLKFLYWNSEISNRDVLYMTKSEVIAVFENKHDAELFEDISRHCAIKLLKN